MSTENDKTIIDENDKEVVDIASDSSTESSNDAVNNSGQKDSKFSRGKRPDRRQKREPRTKPEFEQRIIDIRRVTRVSSGGRKFSFSVSMVVGNKKGSVGVATGKAGDTALAIEKAYRRAKKEAVNLNLTKDMSIPHYVYKKYKSARVEISPAKGKGVVAGSAVRDVIELAGIRDVNSKLRSPTKNKLNIARATVIALSSLKKPR